MQEGAAASAASLAALQACTQPEPRQNNWTMSRLSTLSLGSCNGLSQLPSRCLMGQQVMHRLQWLPVPGGSSMSGTGEDAAAAQGGTRLWMQNVPAYRAPSQPLTADHSLAQP